MDDVVPLGARLSELAGERPDRPAVTDDRRTVTWAEPGRRANRLARGLEKAGAIRDDASKVRRTQLRDERIARIKEQERVPLPSRGRGALKHFRLRMEPQE